MRTALCSTQKQICGGKKGYGLAVAQSGRLAILDFSFRIKWIGKKILNSKYFFTRIFYRNIAILYL